MSSEALVYVFENSSTDGRARVLMLAIADNAGEGGEYVPNIPRLAVLCNIPEPVVQRLIDYCVRIGELRIEAGPPLRYVVAGLPEPERTYTPRRVSLLSRYGARLAERDGGWRCRYCGIELALHGDPGWETRGATVDHVVPVSKGGSNYPDNLVLACRSCNSRKGVMSYEDFVEAGE